MGADAVAFAPTWQELTDVVCGLVEAVRADGVPDVVVGVARGGWVPAVLVSHQLGVRDVRSVAVFHTTSDGIGAPKTDHPTVGDPAALGALAGLDVLVVDDVAGTGQAVRVAADLAEEREATRVRVAVIVVNHQNWFAANNERPEDAIDYVGASCAGWVVFPWELR